MNFCKKRVFGVSEKSLFSNHYFSQNIDFFDFFALFRKRFFTHYTAENFYVAFCAPQCVTSIFRFFPENLLAANNGAEIRAP